MRKKPFFVAHIAASLFFFLICTAAGTADITDSVKKSFAVEPGGTLTLETNTGSIEFSSGTENKALVEVIRVVDAHDQKAAERFLREFDMDFSQSGNNVKITADYSHRHHWWEFWETNRLRAKFRIVVPVTFNLDLHTAGGSISGQDISGSVHCRTSGGSLSFGHIKGPLTGYTSGGSIQVGDCQGTVTLHTSGGSIRLGKVAGPVIAHTSGGSIRVEEVQGTIDASTSGGSITATLNRQPQENCRLITSGGTIDVQLAPTLNLVIHADTSGGRISVDLPLTIQGDFQRTSLHGTLNQGGPQLYLKTSGGNILIHKAD